MSMQKLGNGVEMDHAGDVQTGGRSLAAENAWTALWPDGRRETAGSRVGRLPRIALASLLGISATPALACSVSSGADTGSYPLVLKNELARDVRLTGWLNIGSLNSSFSGCPPRATVRARFTPSMAGLTYVRNVVVDGVTYPAFGWGSTSPLVVFSYVGEALSVGRQIVVADALRPTSTNFVTGGESIVNNKLWVRMAFMLVSRGGAMTPVSNRRLAGVSVLPNDPIAGSLNHDHLLSVAFMATPCTLGDAAVVLDDVRPGAFGGQGSAAGSKLVGLRMNCPVAGTLVRLSVTDSVFVANRSNVLTPTADSTARGVALQLTYNGTPVSMGSVVDFGRAIQGDQSIPLMARYVRTADTMAPGSVRAQAVVTADYQ